MTTISSSTATAVQVAPSRRIAVEPGNEVKAFRAVEHEVTVFRRGTPTAEQTAEVAKRRAAAEELAAGTAKQVREAEKMRPEINEMYLPNIATMSLENARNAAGITRVIIDNRGDMGFNETAMPRATAGQATGPSQANTIAASVYRLMQGMAGNSGTEG
ncbi:hypothetical protein JOD97_006140 [Duganella sp. 1411]|uniref:hypothetical protein n=1 Tax=Duganella sp. 1411 TaxID=2806572 RepID=UPI001AE261AD|nr:hypothetical protein [Duganella sp. 1411]MBP1208053.1 hypothetical protein [Duganella sp. 1411]